MRIKKSAGFVVLPLLLVLAGCAGEKEPKTIEELKAFVAAKAAKNHSYSTDVDTAMKLGAMSVNFESTMQGKDKLLSMIANMDMMGQKITTKTIVDKTNMLWVEANINGLKQAMSLDLAKAGKLPREILFNAAPGAITDATGGLNDPRDALSTMSNSYDLTFAGKEQLGDENVYVVDGTIKPDVKAQFSKRGDNANQARLVAGRMDDMINAVRMKVGAKDGFLRSTQLLDTEGKPWMTQTYKNIKLNPHLDDAAFEYTPPNGVMVMDMAEMTGAMGLSQ